MNPEAEKNAVAQDLTDDCKDIYKRFLEILEDLQEEHKIQFDKLRHNIPQEYLSIIAQADYFTDGKLKHLRKRVLDCGNDAARKINVKICNIINRI